MQGRKSNQMSLDIPSNIEREIKRFAQQHHITPDEAVIRLIESGLSLGKQQTQTLFEQGLGLFGSPQDAAIIDEVVAVAYEERRRPSKPETLL